MQAAYAIKLTNWTGCSSFTTKIVLDNDKETETPSSWMEAGARAIDLSVGVIMTRLIFRNWFDFLTPLLVLSRKLRMKDKHESLNVPWWWIKPFGEKIKLHFEKFLNKTAWAKRPSKILFSMSMSRNCEFSPSPVLTDIDCSAHAFKVTSYTKCASQKNMNWICDWLSTSWTR